MTERPDLTAVATKPDVLVRLRHATENSGDLTHRIIVWRRDINDAIDAITGLRDTCDRRLATIRDLQRELADLRPSEGR